VARQEISTPRLALNAFLFGLISHAITFLVYAAIGWRYDAISLAPTKGFDPVAFADIVDEICVSVVLAGGLAVLWIYGSTYKWATRLLKSIGATRRFGDEDVWDYVLNARIPDVEYLNFRDFANRLVYSGYVEAFSESERLRELVLNEVKILDFDGQLLLTTPRVYIARERANIHVEFPYPLMQAARGSNG
jgi:hypothetical protein